MRSYLHSNVSHGKFSIMSTALIPPLCCSHSLFLTEIFVFIQYWLPTCYMGPLLWKENHVTGDFLNIIRQVSPAGSRQTPFTIMCVLAGRCPLRCVFIAAAEEEGSWVANILLNRSDECVTRKQSSRMTSPQCRVPAGITEKWLHWYSMQGTLVRCYINASGK